MTVATDLDPPTPSRIELARRVAALAGLAGLALSSVGWYLRPYQFFCSYLVGLVFWSSVTAGCLSLILLERAAGSSSSDRLGRVGAAGWKTLPLVALFWLPIGCDARDLPAGVGALGWTMAAGLALTGAVVAGLALGAAVLAWLARGEPAVLPAPLAPRLATGLFVAVLLWAVVGSLPVALAWPPDLPRAVPFYARRMSGGWQSWAAGLAAGQCLLALAVLPGRNLVRRLGCAGASALVACLGWVFWLVAPATSLRADSRLTFHVLDIVAPVTLGGLWLALFFWRLDRRPPRPLQGLQGYDPGAQA